MTVDGLIANVGSANLNRRSLDCDEEINLVALDSDTVGLLDDQFDEDLRRSVRLQPGPWESRSPARRLAELMSEPLRRLS
jgi:cardiolipin synthase